MIQWRFENALVADWQILISFYRMNNIQKTTLNWRNGKSPVFIIRFHWRLQFKINLSFQSGFHLSFSCISHGALRVHDILCFQYFPALRSFSHNGSMTSQMLSIYWPFWFRYCRWRLNCNCFVTILKTSVDLNSCWKAYSDLMINLLWCAWCMVSLVTVFRLLTKETRWYKTCSIIIRYHWV